MKKQIIISFFIPHLGCTSNCVFCNQKTITGYKSSPYAEEIAKVIKERLLSLPSNVSCEVAFYGGSFTALPWAQQESYLRSAQPFLERGHINGIRLSTRPDAIKESELDKLAQYGVKTIELGVQSLDHKVLEASGRDYEPSLVEKVSLLIKQKGFTLGHQLMIGLPDSDLQTELDTVAQVIEIGPDLARIYPTIVLKGTILARLLQEGKYRPLTLREAVQTATLLLTQLEKAGIKVIRMGLQATPELQQSGEILAGPFHPSFGELVQSEIFQWQAMHVITSFMERKVTNRLKLYVHKRDLSKMIGQDRRNLRALKDRFKLDNLEVIGIEGAEKAWVGVGQWQRKVPQLVLSRQEFL